MQTATPEEVRTALAQLDSIEQKIVSGMLTVMINEPANVRDAEWMSKQLTQMTLMAGTFDAESPEDGIEAVQVYLKPRAENLMRSSFLLFHRVALDMEPLAEKGFGMDDAIRCGLTYLPGVQEQTAAAVVKSMKPADLGPLERDLGLQPLARKMRKRGFSPKDLVEASPEQLTHKMISRAMKGRRLTANTMGKVVRAWNLVSGLKHTAGELFTYRA